MREVDRIHQKREAFSQALSKIVLCHHRRPFADDVVCYIWTECQYIDAEAWSYIADKFVDLDSPPRNTAKAMKAFHQMWQESSAYGKRYAPEDAKPVYKEGVIGPRILHHKRNGMSGWNALAAACEEFKRGELGGAPVGKGPVFDAGSREQKDLERKFDNNSGPKRAGR